MFERWLVNHGFNLNAWCRTFETSQALNIPYQTCREVGTWCGCLRSFAWSFAVGIQDTLSWNNFVLLSKATKQQLFWFCRIKGNIRQVTNSMRCKVHQYFLGALALQRDKTTWTWGKQRYMQGTRSVVICETCTSLSLWVLLHVLPNLPPSDSGAQAPEFLAKSSSHANAITC